jgi:hypothetical protein
MSDQQTTENFWQVWNTFTWPEDSPVFYRLYYDKNGRPTCYTMEDLPGNYIEVDKETYVLHQWNVRVIDGKLVVISPTVSVNKLYPTAGAGVACSIDDICVIVPDAQPHTTWNTLVNDVE